MTLFRLVLAVVWLAVVIITVQAALAHGIGTAVDVFSADLQAGDWRSQFTADLLGSVAAHVFSTGNFFGVELRYGWLVYRDLCAGVECVSPRKCAGDIAW